MDPMPYMTYYLHIVGERKIAISSDSTLWALAMVIENERGEGRHTECDYGGIGKNQY